MFDLTQYEISALKRKCVSLVVIVTQDISSEPSSAPIKIFQAHLQPLDGLQDDHEGGADGPRRDAASEQPKAPGSNPVRTHWQS